MTPLHNSYIIDAFAHEIHKYRETKEAKKFTTWFLGKKEVAQEVFMVLMKNRGQKLYDSYENFLHDPVVCTLLQEFFAGLALHYQLHANQGLVFSSEVFEKEYWKDMVDTLAYLAKSKEKELMDRVEDNAYMVVSDEYENHADGYFGTPSPDLKTQEYNVYKVFYPLLTDRDQKEKFFTLHENTLSRYARVTIEQLMNRCPKGKKETVSSWIQQAMYDAQELVHKSQHLAEGQVLSADEEGDQ